MNARPRIAIVGAGTRGSLYGRALAENPDVDVVGVTDLNAPTGRAAAARLGVPDFGSFEELCELAAPSAVVVATPDFAHRDTAVAAAEQGLDIMVEKPLATTLSDAEEIVQAVLSGGGRSMVAYENRWNPRFAAVRSARAELLGDINHQIVHLNDTQSVPMKMLPWASESSPAWFLMPHSLDIALWMSEKAVGTVYATGSRRVLASSGIDTWDTIDASITFTDGTTASLHSTWVLPDSYPSVYDFRYEAVGSMGAIRINASDQGIHAYSTRGEWLQWGTYELDHKLQGFPVSMANTFAKLTSGEDVDVPTVDDGLTVTRVIAAIHESLDSKEPIVMAR